MTGKIEQAELALTESVVQTDQALTALGDAAEGGEVAGGLPRGWSDINLESLAKFIDYRGKTPKKTADGIPLITAKNIRDGFINREPREFIAEEDYDDWMTRGIPRLGDVVITTEAPMGNVARIDISEKFALAQRSICLYLYNQEMSGYLFYALRSPEFIEKLGMNSTGTTVKGIKSGTLKKLEIPLPPLAEQTVIAQTLDTLLAQVDNIKNRLDAIPKILKTFRQCVLAAAVSGKLTEEWRGENGCEFSTWKELALRECFECIDGDRGPNYPKKEEYINEGYCLFLSTKNVRPYGFDFSKTVYISEEKDQILRKGRMKRGDIVITTRGTLGYVASYDDSVTHDVIRINSGMLILRKKDDSFDNDYFKILIASPKFQKEIDIQRTGSAQPQLPAKILKEFLLNVPPAGEQTEIVRRVEELFAFADQIEHQVKNAQGRVNNLTQSILAKAFRGELTTQWRVENPDLISGKSSAEALLAKIQAERDKLAPKKKPKTTRKKVAKK